MSEYGDYVSKLDISELDMPAEFKAAVHPIIEYILNTKASFSAVIRLASLMMESCKGDLKVAKWFAAIHPENRIEIYSSPDIFLSFYFLYLARKVDNLMNANLEGICSEYHLSCAQDQETCSICRDHYTAGKLSECTFQTVPPFHVGCRCGMIFTK